jgi:hypothetical protein
MAMAVKIIDAVLHWTIATLIAGVIAYIMLYAHSKDTTPCIQRQCYQLLDARLAAIEAELAVRTEDRYHGTDAKRDQALMLKEINNVRAELNKRIDGLKK